MYARVNEFKGTARQLRDTVRDAEEIAGEVDSLPGSLGMYYLLDPEAGKALSITLWESREAMKASESQAARIRESSTRAEGTTIVSVEGYEVVANTARVAASVGRG